MKKLLIIFILLVKICHAQNNRDKRNYLVYAAQVSLYDKNYNQSLKYFTKAFKYAPAQTSYELLTAASVAFKLNKVKIAESYLKESITKYKVPLELINTYPKLAPYKNSKLIKKINSSYDNLLKEYYFHLKNISAYLEVEQLVTKDQYVRSLTNYYLGVSDEEGGEMLFNYINAVNKKDSSGIEKYGRYVNFKDKNLENLKFKLMENTDSLNMQKYIDITKRYGYFENGWILLWHHRGTYNESNFVWNFFKPYLNSEIEKGNLDRDFFVAFEDDYHISKKGKQRYGAEAQYDIYPVEDIKNVDLLREKVGLPPLYYDKIIYDIDIPKDYVIDEKKFRDSIFSKVKSL